MLVAVTGAGGHLGGTLVRRLLDSGDRVRAIDLGPSPALEGLDVEFVEGDVTDPQRMREALADVDGVYHLAAVISVVGDPTGLVERVNAQGPAVVADAALDAGVARFVHCSSVHAYDLSQVEGTLDEDGPRSIAASIPAYDRSKWSGELEVYRRVEKGLDAVVVNPSGVIGPNDYSGSRMGEVFRAVRDERLPAIVDGGFDWVDVRDVAEGLRSAFNGGATGENYLLSGARYDIVALTSLAAAEAGVAPPTRVLPRWAAKAWGPVGTWIARRNENALSMTSESMHALFNGPEISSAKASTDLGYTARPIEETIADSYAWFDENGL